MASKQDHATAVAAQQAATKAQTFGAEIEMAGITRQRAAEIIAAHFGTTAFDAHIAYGYRAWAAKDPTGRVWKCVSDSSIQDANNGCEFVTPICRWEDIETVQNLVRKFRAAGAKSDPDLQCGIHVHVGADIGKPGGHTATTLRNLVNMMVAKEQLLTAALEISRDRQRWCRWTDDEFLSNINARPPKTIDELMNVWYDGRPSRRYEHYDQSRYHMLNLHATFSKGTVEFRCFNGTLHAGKVKTYIQLAMAMNAAAKLMKTCSPRKAQMENEKYAIRTWLLRLGFIGDEFATARKHLTEACTGDTAWRQTEQRLHAEQQRRAI